MSLRISLVSQKEFWQQWRFSSPSWIHRMKDWTKCCCRCVLIKYFSLWIWAALPDQNQHFVNWVLTLAPRGIDRHDFMVQTGAKSAARCLSAPADASHFLKSTSSISLSSAQSSKTVACRPDFTLRGREKKTSCLHLDLRKIPSSAKSKRRQSTVTQWGSSSLMTHWFIKGCRWPEPPCAMKDVLVFLCLSCVFVAAVIK